MKNILFSNYSWENDDNGKDQYDYAREYLFEEYAEEEGWESESDVPDERVNSEVSFQEECNWDDFKAEFGRFIKDSTYGFLLVGDVGTWRGRVPGGCYVYEFRDLYKFWDHCDCIKVYDEGGHLYIEASHHDGTNYAELKELTCKGSEYAGEHYWESDKEVHEKLWNSNFYTRLPRYAQKIWG